MLTKAQLKRIEEIIKERFLVFTYESLGERALSEDELRELKRLGVLRANVRDFVGDGYTLGKIAQLVDRTTATSLTFEQVLTMSKRMLKAPTDVEKKMIDWARNNSARYIQGIRDDMVKEVAGAASRAAVSAIRTVQDEVAGAIEARETVGELKTSLFRAIDDRFRDWQRVASTEMQGAIQHGIYHEIREKRGAAQLVFKRPNPNACKYCKKVYLESDGYTPRVFMLSELADTNYGRRAADWNPTIGPVHPWCQCQLMEIPDGYDFKTMWVVSEPFDRYKKGEIISEAVYAELDIEDRKKLRKDAGLEYTGTTAKPSTAKSFRFDSDEDDDHDCLCSY